MPAAAKWRGIAALLMLPGCQRRSERIVTLGELLDESRASFEQLRELVDAQLPRYVVHP